MRPELEETASEIVPETLPSCRQHPTWDDYNADCASTDSQMSDLEVRIIALEEPAPPARNPRGVIGRCLARRLLRSKGSWLGCSCGCR
jgi:hypothetical protein